ncbi:MAG: hypothetical protein MUC95_07930 [Spirochaetes bacterium]|nr:hypothetical protein [Spirochaetota bacterium]
MTCRPGNIKRTGAAFRIGLILIIINFIVFSVAASGQEIPAPYYNKNKIYRAYGEHNDTGLVFFSEVDLLFDTGFYTENSLSHTMLVNRTFNIDVLRCNNYVLSLFVDEERSFRSQRSGRFSPLMIHYNMDYANIRREYRRGSLSYFVDHQCTNIINQNDIGQRELRYYGMGFKWETHGMRAGHKNDNIVFSKPGRLIFLYNFEYTVLVSQCLANGYAKRFKNNMFIKSAFRYDALRVFNVIPYLECEATAIVDERYQRVRFNRTAETGLRMHFRGADFTPFFSYVYKNDAEVYNGPQLDAYLAGFRLEALLYSYEPGTEKTDSTGSGSFEILPEIRFLCQYAKLLFNKNLNYNHKINFEADVVKAGQLYLFFSSGLLHNSPGHGGLWPYYLDSTIGGGVWYLLEDACIVIRPYYFYRSFDDGNHYRGYRERYHIAGLEVKSRNMHLGYINCDIDPAEKTDMRRLNRFGWSISGGRVVRDLNYPYDWDLSLRLQWDILIYHGNIPYLALQAGSLHGEKSVREFGTEIGTHFYKAPALFLFFQHIYRSREDPDNNLYRNQYLLGVRVEL